MSKVQETPRRTPRETLQALCRLLEIDDCKREESEGPWFSADGSPVAPELIIEALEFARELVEGDGYGSLTFCKFGFAPSWALGRRLDGELRLGWDQHGISRMRFENEHGKIIDLKWERDNQNENT
jgi:hypothetical protein